MRMILTSWRKYLFMVVVFGGGTVFFWWGSWPVVSAFFGGYLLGILVRDFMWLTLTTRFWPVSA